MANEIQISANWTLNNIVNYIASRSKTSTQSGSWVDLDIRPIKVFAGGTGTQLKFGGDVQSDGNKSTVLPGYIHVFNASTLIANGDTLDLGLNLNLSQKFGTLVPGEMAVFRPTSTSLWVTSRVNPQTMVIFATDA